jgi:hypothetical protein
MSCGCKKKKQVLNNISSREHIEIAKEVNTRVILGSGISNYTELDKIEIMGVYSSLYPNSSGTPSLEDAIKQIQQAISTYDVRRK